MTQRVTRRQALKTAAVATALPLVHIRTAGAALLTTRTNKHHNTKPNTETHSNTPNPRLQLTKPTTNPPPKRKQKNQKTNKNKNKNKKNQKKGASGGAYKYRGGEYYNESLPAAARYADLMFKLSEKFKTAVSAKYLAPGEELDPDALITVADDDDLQELVDEYYAHLERPGTPSRTFRIRLFAFTATEEPLTPDEILEGESFFLG